MDAKARANAAQKVTLIGALVNLLLAILKIIIGTLGNSGALIADGIHSFSDLLSDAMVLYATKHAQDDADAEHPYGHERFETIATLGLAVLLGVVGLGIIIDAAERLSNPAELTHSALLLSIALLSILSKEGLYWYTLNVAKACQSDLLKANAWHHRTDAWSSIIVLVGIIGGLNGYLYLDGIAAIVVGVMVLHIGWGLGFDAARELVDTSIEAEKVAQLKYSISQIHGVDNVHSLRTRKSGNLVSCDVHVQVGAFLSVSEGHRISVSVDRAVQQCCANLRDVMVHIDPEDDENSLPCAQLPERNLALNLIDDALKKYDFSYVINHTRLHFLHGKIYVDFYLPLHYLTDKNSAEGILAQLKTALGKLDDFDKIRVYFGDD